MTFPITCMDNTTVVVAMDPASTSSEVLDSVAADGKVRDTFGCCIVMKVAEKVRSLGIPACRRENASNTYKGRCGNLPM